ncbi:S-adenosyl-L-methionine-dependent methyltransferase [Whalleya microplaca]|nr:S-adenosyl-L-methionine-dependent methyltransferase [Whalleya microplaca]
MASESEYVFTRDYADNNRINSQHYLWCELYGYHIHPKIPIKDANVRVADVGTGTGIWLRDVGARLPKSVQLEGLDISFKAAPPPEWLSSNVRLRYWNIREPVPDELLGAYDIVHIRNFSFVLKDDEIDSVLGRLIQITKLGGYLQWAEPDVASFRVGKRSPDTNADYLRKLYDLTQSLEGLANPTWVPRLPGVFEEHGLQAIESDVREAPHDLALAMHECNLPIHELIAQQTRNKELAQRLEQLMPEVCRQTREGSLLSPAGWWWERSLRHRELAGSLLGCAGFSMLHRLYRILVGITVSVSLNDKQNSTVLGLTATNMHRLRM